MTNYKWWLNPVRQRMLYSSTHMATVSVKGLTLCESRWSMCDAVGGWEGVVLLEQRVHHESDWRKLNGDLNDHVSRSLPDLKGTLEPDDRGSGLQRPEDIHGNQQQAVWRTDVQLQGRTTKVIFCHFLHLLTLWRPVVPHGYSYKASYARPC